MNPARGSWWCARTRRGWRCRRALLAGKAARLLDGKAAPLRTGDTAPRGPVRIPGRRFPRGTRISASRRSTDCSAAATSLRRRTALSQTGQFSAQETVTLIGPRGSLDRRAAHGTAARARPGRDFAQRRVRAGGGCAGADLGRSSPTRPASRSKDPTGRLTLTSGRHLRTAPHPHVTGGCGGGSGSAIATSSRCGSTPTAATCSSAT